jgi:hypothetical protein
VSICINETLCFRVGATLPTGQLSNVPWRRTGVKYTNNEAYFDVIEEIDAIIDKSGTTVIAEIQGYVCLHKTDIFLINKVFTVRNGLFVFALDFQLLYGNLL